MKSKHIIYPVAFLLMLWVPIARYYSSTPWVNACVIDYVDNMGESNYQWYMYDINWVKHIEPWNSKIADKIGEYKIWESIWCLMVSDNLFSDLNNTFYCTITYLIRKVPIDEKYKQPLWILKNE